MVSRIFPQPVIVVPFLGARELDFFRQPATSDEQPFLQLVCRDPHHANDFVSAALAGSYRNRRARQVQKLREVMYASLVSAAIDRWRSEGDFQRVTEFADNSVSPPTRLHFDRESDAGRGFMKRDH